MRYSIGPDKETLRGYCELLSYPSIQTCVLGAQKNRLIETVLLSTQNICFGWEIRNTHSYREA